MPHPASDILRDPQRLATLRRLGVVDALDQPAFDRLARLAAAVLDAPVALVALIDEDRQLLPGCLGLPEPWASRRETPLSHSFCRHNLDAAEPLVITDARKHPLVRDNLAIADLGVIAYLGLPLVVLDGQPLGSLCVIDHRPRAWTPRDIAILTDLAAAVVTEIELRVALHLTKELERAREQFLAAVAHDLKTPLTTIRGNAQLAQRQLGQPDAQLAARLAERLTNIVVATDQATALVAEQLDLARLDAGQPLELDRHPTDLVALVRRVVAQHQATAPHCLRVDTSLAALVAPVDAPRLERVVSNLLTNAMKYSPANGAVTLRIEREETRVGALAVITVADEGLGIPAVDLPRVFEPFHRGSNVAGHIPGTGIGLASARQFVEAHGGVITVESTEGVGTTVTIRLPLLACADSGDGTDA